MSDDRSDPLVDPVTPPVTGSTVSPPPVTVTDRARAHVLAALDGLSEPVDPVLRIAIAGIDGADYTYDLGFVAATDAESGDRVDEHDGLTVLVPAASVSALWGATLDIGFAPGLVIRNPNRPAPVAADRIDLDGSVADRVEMLLARVINPGLAAHDGQASLVEVDETDGIARITMSGRCQGCAVSDLTVRAGIRRVLLDRIPELDDVVDVTDHALGTDPFHR